MGENAQAMSDSAVKAIQQSVETKTINVDGVDFVTRQVYDPPGPNRVETLLIATLTGIVEFVNTQNLNGDPENVEGSGIIIQVEGPNTVAVKGPISDDRSQQRSVYARATAPNPFAKGFTLGRYYELSEFNIALRCLFDNYGDRDAIIALLGNVTGTQVAEGSDDGFTQAVTVRRNVVKVGNEKVKNPVRLYPYRTFREIMQPWTEFILRLQSDPDNEEPPTAALFDADGIAWEQRAVLDVAAYLKNELPDEVVIG